MEANKGLVISSFVEMLSKHGGSCETFANSREAVERADICSLSSSISLVWYQQGYPFPSLRPRVQKKVTPAPEGVPVFQASQSAHHMPPTTVIDSFWGQSKPSAGVTGEETSILSWYSEKRNAYRCE